MKSILSNDILLPIFLKTTTKHIDVIEIIYEKCLTNTLKKNNLECELTLLLALSNDIFNTIKLTSLKKFIEEKTSKVDIIMQHFEKTRNVNLYKINSSVFEFTGEALLDFKGYFSNYK